MSIFKIIYNNCKLFSLNNTNPKKFAISKIDIDDFLIHLLPLMNFWVNNEDNHIGSGAENNPVVCFSADDNLITDYTVIYPYLKARGFNGTSFVTTDTIDGGATLLTSAQLIEMYNNGWDVAVHSYHHPDGIFPPEYEDLTDAEIRLDMQTAINDLLALGIITPDTWTPPRFSSFYTNVRRIGSEFFNGMRTGINNHNISWNDAERNALGMLGTSFSTDGTLTNAMNALDVAIINKSTLHIYCHELPPAYAVRFRTFIDYCVTKGIDVISFKELYDRIEAHQSFYIDKARKINLLTGIFEKRTFTGYDGWIIFGCTLAELTVTIAEKIESELNYKISFYTDITDLAFKYAIPFDNWRAYLQSLNVKCVYDVVNRDSGLLFANNAYVSTLNQYGFEYFSNLSELTLSGMPNLTGTMPDSLGSMSRMKYFKIVNCKISGNVPICLRKMIEIEIIQLNGNELTGYEKGAFSVYMSRLNYVHFGSNKFTEQAINDILCDLRDMVAIQKNFNITYPPPHPDYYINLSGGTNHAPTGLGLIAKTQLQNAIAQLGGMVNWTVLTN